MWKFWKKDNAAKLSKPKDLPSGVGRYLVVDLNYDPDWVWSLKAVTKPKDNQKNLFDFLIFDPLRTKAGEVRDYDSLEGKSELICFNGWYDKNTWKMEVNDLYKTLKEENAA